MPNPIMRRRLGGRAQTVSLPRNLVIANPTVLDSLDNVALWTATSSPSGGTAVQDTTYVKEGTGGIKVTTPASAGWTSIERASLNWTCGGNINFWVYCHDTTEPSNFTMRMSNENSDSNRWLLSYNSGVKFQFRPGWNYVNIRTADWAVGAGAPSWSNPIQYCRILFYTSGTAHSYTIDGLYTGGQRQPAVLLTFNDTRTSHYTEAFAYMQARNARGTCYLHGDLIDTGGRLSWAQALTMNANGWTIGSRNDTTPTEDMSVLSQAQAETVYGNIVAMFAANGFSAWRRHVSYPGGIVDADMRLAMAAQAMLSGRTLVPWSTYKYNGQLPWPQWTDMNCTETGESTSQATVQGWIDLAVARQSFMSIIIRDLLVSPAGADWYIDRFRGIVNYCIAQNIPLITVDDLYRLESGPVTIPMAK